MNQVPFGGLQSIRDSHYTGQNINATAGSRTPRNANLRRGDVLQLDPFDHDNVKGLNPAVNVGAGFTAAVPTATFASPIVVVAEEPDPSINDIQNTSTGLRRGGRCTTTSRGRVQARVTGSVTKGVTPLTINAGEVVLRPAAPTTVAHLLLRVGTSQASRPVGYADETGTFSDELCWVVLTDGADD